MFSISLSDFITWVNNNFRNDESKKQEDNEEDQNSENDENEEEDDKDDSYIWWKWGVAFTSDEGNGQSTGFMAFNTFYVNYELIDFLFTWTSKGKNLENKSKNDSFNDKAREEIESQRDGPSVGNTTESGPRKKGITQYGYTDLNDSTAERRIWVSEDGNGKWRRIKTDTISKHDK